MDPSSPQRSLLAIFDGHKGVECANFCRDRLASNVIAASNFGKPDCLEDILKEAIEKTDKEFLDSNRLEVRPWFSPFAKCNRQGHWGRATRRDRRPLYSSCRAIRLQFPTRETHGPSFAVAVSADDTETARAAAANAGSF